MTDDEMERTIQFILQQQAQFAAQQAEITGQQARFAEWQAQINAQQSKTETQIGKLTDAILTITGVMGKLAEAQTKTEERLNAFIVFVERYISEGRNGKH